MSGCPNRLSQGLETDSDYPLTGICAGSRTMTGSETQNGTMQTRDGRSGQRARGLRILWPRP